MSSGWTTRISRDGSGTFGSELSKYKPTMKFANINSQTLGFFPLRNELIRETTVLSKSEKAVLVKLNGNSRIKLSGDGKEAQDNPGSGRVHNQEAQKMGIIKRFTALTQDPNKRIFYAYGVSLIPIEGHSALRLALARSILEEDLHETVNDYALVANANGGYDAFYICAFKNGEDLSKRGPELLREKWLAEDPKIDRAMLTDIIVGKWPFHLEDYDQYRRMVESE